MSNIDMMMECGWSKPVTTLILSHKDELIKVICLHHILLKSKAEMDQVKEGLAVMGVDKIMANQPQCLRSFFVFDPSKVLTAG